ncbi:MAG TPA: SpoIIE family protein phosphatase [Solirubrobacteraceae bacterium]|nr:SpoIIE family protein phosphatase [Solirubrobacteraceae bacterium]
MRRGSAGRPTGAVALGVLIAGGLAAADGVSGQHAIVIGTVVLAPFVVSMLARPPETAAVAMVAVALVFVSGVWDHNFDSGAYYLRGGVVVVGGALSVLVALTRERTDRDSERFELLAAIADVADGRLTLEENAARVCATLVPRVADICVLDVVHDGELQRLAVKASGPEAAQREARLREHRLPSLDEPGLAAAVASGRSQLLPSVTGERPRTNAGIVVALTGRGQTLGALALLVTGESGRTYVPEDLRFVEVLAGRVALALDNAGLFTERQTMESQLTTVLGNLSEAVTVQNPRGNLIYANHAAADILGYVSPQQLVATPAGDIAERFRSFREDGSPLQLSDLPGRRVLTGETPTPLVVRVVDTRTGAQRWRMTKSSAVRDSAGDIKMVVNVIADITAVKRAELVQRLLVETGEALASSLDPRRTLQHVADLCVPELADWCAVSLPDEHEQLRSVAVVHTDPDKVALAQRVGERYPVALDGPGGAAQVFRDQLEVCTNDITDEMLIAAAKDDEHLEALRSLGMRAALVVPMTSGGRSIGVLSLVSAESGRSFGEEDVALASELARRAATAVENARLYSERSSIARTLQTSLLPDALPHLPGWRTATLYRPAGDENQVGGDFYEAVPLDGEWVLVVGDVTGRGAPAASLTGLMRHTLRTAATLTGSVTRALEKLNSDLIARPQLSLCTAVCLVLRDRDGQTQADILCAGHPPPILIRGGAAEEVGRFGPMLGAYTDACWEPWTVAVRPGDVLVLYSDGLLDATGSVDRFGAERLRRTLTGASGAHDVMARIKRALAEFQVGAQADDTAVLAVERIGAPADLMAGGPGLARGETGDARAAPGPDVSPLS